MTQAMRALARANEVKARRCELRGSIRTREKTLREVLDAEIPDWLANMPVAAVLMAVPRLKHEFVLRALRQAGVSEIRPVGSIPLRQRRALLSRLEELSPMLRRAS